MPTSNMVSLTYGRGAIDRRREARAPTVEGARAALESFYFAFNQRSMIGPGARMVPILLPLGGN